jgi:hypothetical protein
MNTAPLKTDGAAILTQRIKLFAMLHQPRALL